MRIDRLLIDRLLIATTAALCLAGCNPQQAPGAGTTPAEPNDRSPATAAPLYALQATDNSWPALEGMDTLADNLLAENYYIVFDGSGSMAGEDCTDGRSKMEEAKFAVSQFLNRIPAEANVGLFVFDMAGISERAPLGPTPRPALVKIINDSQAGGGTPLSAGIEQGYRALLAQGQRQLGYGQYNLVVVTDGEASPGFDPAGVVGHVLAQSPVNLHTIGFCIGTDHSLNQTGRTFYKAADDPKSLAQGLEAVLAEVPDFAVNRFGE